MTPASTYLALCAALASGVYLGFNVATDGAFWPFVALLTALTVLVGYGLSFRWWGYVATFLLGITVSFASVNDRSRFFDYASLQSGKIDLPLKVESFVNSFPAKNGGKWISFNTSHSGIDMRVTANVSDDTPDPKIGEIRHVVGWLPRKIDRCDFRRLDVWCRGHSSCCDLIESPSPSSLASAINASRQSFSQRLAIGLDSYPEAVDLNRAIMLGERRNLPYDVRNTFINAGTMHVFAVSGLHVMIVASVLVALLMLTPIPRRFRSLFVIPALWWYVAMTGMPPSAVRAAAMATLYFLAPTLLRRPNSLIAWSIVFLICHTFKPELMMNAGALFSFAVMLALLLWTRWARNSRSKFIAILGVTFATWAAGVPLAARLFGRFTPGGLVANPILIPLASVSVISGTVGVALSFISDALATYANNISGMSTRLMYAISYAISSIPGSSFEVAKWSLWQCIAWYAVILLVLYLVSSVSRRHHAAL